MLQRFLMILSSITVDRRNGRGRWTRIGLRLCPDICNVLLSTLFVKIRLVALSNETHVISLQSHVTVVTSV